MACHARSNSFPSNSHPLIANVEDHLYRLMTSEASSSAPICSNLCGFKDLYESINDVLHLPSSKQALSHGDKKCLEDVLDGSLRLLDICGTTRDVLMQMKESVQDLESSLRRKRGGECGLENEIGAYMKSRKRISKMVSKFIGDLKKSEKKCTSELLEKDNNILAIVRIIKEAESISLSALTSVLSHTSGPRTRSRQSTWSLVANLMQPKRVSCETEEESGVDEAEKIVLVLSNLIKQKSNIKAVQLQTLLKQLEALEMNIQKLEDGLELVFRCLVKARVSLLNALSH